MAGDNCWLEFFRKLVETGPPFTPPTDLVASVGQLTNQLKVMEASFI
jgi:hypothetical protein